LKREGSSGGGGFDTTGEVGVRLQNDENLTVTSEKRGSHDETLKGKPATQQGVLEAGKVELSGAAIGSRLS